MKSLINHKPLFLLGVMFCMVLFLAGFGSATITTTLNSPADGYTSLTNLVTLNATGSVTGGAYLANVTLYDNSTGSWGARNTTNLYSNVSILSSANINLPTINTQTGGSYDTKHGMQIYVSKSMYLNNVTQKGSQTTAYVCSNPSCSSIIAQASFSGTVATFSTPVSLISGNYYWIVADGTLEKRWTDNSNTYPKTTSQSYLNITNGVVAGVINKEHYDFVYLGVSPYQLTISTQTFTNTYSSGDSVLWNVQACANDGTCGFAPSNYTFTIDNVAPVITVVSGSGTQDYGIVSRNHTINFTVEDNNLNYCTLEYNGTNRSIPCYGVGVDSVNFTLQPNVYTATIYAHDTTGNIGSLVVNWDYKVFENSRAYTENALSISLEFFILNITTDETQSPSAIFYYNGTSYTASKTTSGNNILFSTSIYTPAVTSEADLTFYWNITYGSTTFQTTQTNQTVSPIELTQCTSGTKFLTINIKDELTGDFLSNATINKLFFRYYVDNEEYYQTLNGSYTQNNISFCLDPSWGTINLWGEFSYESESYIKRYYYFLGEELTNSTTTINVYGLEATESTSFVTYLLDSASVAVPNAYLILKKRIIEENDYRIVEMAKTDEFGMSILHFVTEDERYKIEFYDEDGNYLYETDEFPAVCLDAVCTLEFKLPYEYDVNPFEELSADSNFIYALSATNTSVSLVYNSANGSAYNILYKVYGLNVMNDSVELCSQTENSVISGTLSCNVTNSGFNKFLVHVYLNGKLEISEYKSIKDNRWGNFGDTGLIIAMFMVLAFVLLFAWHWVLVMVGAVAGLIISILAGFIAGSFVSVTFLIVAIIYIIYVGGKR